VRSDRRLLRRLLQNLVSNAVKYTPQGRVLIGCRRRQGRLRVDVYDTGLGIPQSKQRAIFNEFHRLDQGAKVARGLGLGLSIVERIARVLDHRIELQSKPGQGSHFSVEAPLAPALPGDARARVTQRVDVGQLSGMLVLCVDNEPKIQAPREVAAPDRGQLSGVKVLCIDNEPKVLDGMETLLGGWGCRALKAGDLKSALAVVAEAKAAPNGLLVDYHLDTGNGIEAIGALRWRFGAELPAILITADRSPHVREDARARDIQVLHKPLKPAALRALIAQWRVQRMAAAE